MAQTRFINKLIRHSSSLLTSTNLPSRKPLPHRLHHYLQQNLASSPPHLPPSHLISRSHHYHSSITRHFSKKSRDDTDEEDLDDDDGEEDDEDGESSDEDEGGEIDNENVTDCAVSRVYSAEEKAKEAADIGYKVVGPLLRSDRVFKDYEVNDKVMNDHSLARPFHESQEKSSEVKREELLQVAQSAVSGLKINADLGSEQSEDETPTPKAELEKQRDKIEAELMKVCDIAQGTIVILMLTVKDSKLLIASDSKRTDLKGNITYVEKIKIIKKHVFVEVGTICIRFGQLYEKFYKDGLKLEAGAALIKVWWKQFVDIYKAALKKGYTDFKKIDIDNAYYILCGIEDGSPSAYLVYCEHNSLTDEYSFYHKKLLFQAQLFGSGAKYAAPVIKVNDYQEEAILNCVSAVKRAIKLDDHCGGNAVVVVIQAGKAPMRFTVLEEDPDKGGDPEKFKEAQAYEVLSDSEKREIFDQCGGGSSGGRRRQRRGEDVVHPLKVSLEDLYNGTAKKLSLSRNVLCAKCKGKGSKSGASMKCAGCQGSGMKVSIRYPGPSMIQQMQHACNECKGTGESINEKDRCPQCKGEKVSQEKKVLEVVVKGMQNGQKITFPGEADKAPDTVTGDIVFVLQQKEHPKFTRKGDDLFVNHTLSLTEALCGFQFVLTHLDNRQLLIKSEPGEVVKPDQFKAVNDEGMPMYQRPFMKGKLYIHFSVDFPDSLTLDQCKSLETVLPPRTSAQLSDMEMDECEETTLHDVNIDDEMRRKQTQAAQEAYDEDEDMHGGGA